MIRIMVDSSADYTTAQLREKQIAMAPMTISVNNEQYYKDEVELDRKDLYRMLLQIGAEVKTSQPSPEDYLEEFRRAKEAGDNLICICLSSALSGTYRSAMLARDMVKYDGIYVIDSLSATVGIQIMAEKAQQLAAEGMSAAEIVAQMEILKGRLRIVAVVDTLKYLYLGGRVSHGTALVADAVNIKPGIVITREGTVGVSGKYLGINRAVKDLVRQLTEDAPAPDYPVCLLYSSDDTNCEKLRKAMEAAGIRVDRVVEIGATLGVHIGPGAFGVVCVAR